MTLLLFDTPDTSDSSDTPDTLDTFHLTLDTVFMTIGFIGLGKMGSRIVKKLVADGHTVHAWNRSGEVVDELVKQGVQVVKADTVEQLVGGLSGQKIVWVMLPSGEASETVLQEVSLMLSPGDILIDGANSKYTDTERRYVQFQKAGLKFIGIGVSGGVIAATEGYPLMVGGDKSAYDVIVPILDTLAKPHGSHAYFGPGGAGHYVKMVHNGIEYGIMQSLAEGFEVLEKADYKYDLVQVAKLYQRGTLVSGFMMDRLVEALEANPKLEGIVGSIDATGEAEWTVEAGRAKGVEAEIIEASLDYRRRSKTDEKIQQSFTARMVAALRNAFGGHAVKKMEKGKG